MAKKAKLKVSIIIPVHNQFNFLDHCLKSIFQSTNQKLIDYEIVFSDSDSDSNVSDYYKIFLKTNQWFTKKQVKIIRDTEKPGFSRAVNNGMKICQKSDYYVWLNSDTFVTKNWLLPLLSKKFDLCSPISNNATYQTMIQIELKWLRFLEKFMVLKNKQLQKLNLKVDFLNGFCYIISNKVFEQVGFLDEINFPHYGSEDDYSLRSKLRGFQACILSESFVYHYGNQSYQSNINSEIRNIDKPFLQKYPEDWFNKLIHLHTVKTRNLRQQLMELYLNYASNKKI